MHRTTKLLLLSVIFTMQGLATAAQTNSDLQEAFRDAARSENAAAFFQAVSFFGASPGISGASYRFEDDGPDPSKTDVDLLKLPITHDFKSTEVCIAAVRCVRPYAELSLSYLRAKEELAIPEFGDLEIDFDLKTFSALAGAGLSIPLSEGAFLRPILLFGYSRVIDDSELRGEFSDVIDAAASGILFDVEIDSLIYGAAAELGYRREVRSDVDFEAHLRYNQVRSDVISASDRSLKRSNDFGVVTTDLEVDVKTGYTLFSRDVHAIGSIGGTYLPGRQGDNLDSDFYHEVGGGLELKEDRIIKGVKGLKLFGRYIFGDDVTGYKFGVKLTF